MFSSVLTFFAIFSFIFSRAMLQDTANLAQSSPELIPAGSEKLPPMQPLDLARGVSQAGPSAGGVLEHLGQDAEPELSQEYTTEIKEREGTQGTQNTHGTDASATLDRGASTFTPKSKIDKAAEQLQDKQLNAAEKTESPKKCCITSMMFGSKTP